MICDKCKVEIKGKEIKKSVIIQYLLICEECSKKITHICHTCYEPIYKDELVYEISPNWSAEYIFGASQSEKLIQCMRCRKGWLLEQKAKSRWWNKRKWMLWICSVLLLSIILFWLYPILEESWIKIFYKQVVENDNKKQVLQLWKGLIVCGCILVLSSFITFVLYRMISLEFIDRHKDRRRPRKKEKTKNKNKN